jgi:CRISPR-associated protein Cas2
MESYGQRVQKSIFECELEKIAFFKMRKHVEHVIDPEEDSVMYFRLCSTCFEKGLALGQCTRMLSLKEVEVI